MKDLATAWMRTARRFDAAGDLAAVGADLLGRYAEKHRHYHDTSHLAAVLLHIDELADAADEPDVVRLAAWFHDAVYDPQASDNEERSAQLAEELLPQLRVATPVVEEVGRLVRLTASHQPVAGDRDGAVLVDADLAILGSDPGAYALYRAAVRAEYQHLDDISFNLGRERVLNRLLARQPLFTTAIASAQWEARARHNMLAELAELR